MVTPSDRGPHERPPASLYPVDPCRRSIVGDPHYVRVGSLERATGIRNPPARGLRITRVKVFYYGRRHRGRRDQAIANLRYARERGSRTMSIGYRPSLVERWHLSPTGSTLRGTSSPEFWAGSIALALLIASATGIPANAQSGSAATDRAALVALYEATAAPTGPTPKLAQRQTVALLVRRDDRRHRTS